MYSFNVGITLERRLTIGGFYMKPIILETESLQLRPVRRLYPAVERLLY